MGPLSRIVVAVLFVALSGGRAAAHGGHGEHVHVLPAGAAGSDVAIEGGTCTGAARTPPPPVLTGPAFDLRRTPIEKDFRPTWANAGYRLDDAAGRILRPDGKPLPDGEYRRLTAPFDAAAETVEALMWVGLMAQGVRLDEATCFLIDPEGGRKVTRLEMSALKPDEAKGLEFMGLANMRATLRGLPRDKPVPPEVAARLRAAHEAGTKLPQKVLDALAKGAPARQVLADSEAAYASLTRYFDGRQDRESLVRGALPYAPGLNEPARPRALIGSNEERLAEALAKDLRERFATHEAGREMLERFRDKDGVVRLPSVRVLKLSQRPDDPGYGMAAAVQDPSNGSVIINHWVAARIAVAAAPPEKRAALARELGDAAKLNARLLADGDLRRSVLKGVEIIVAHEFVHAWQNRRSHFDVEMMRGNIPASNPLEKEHEAYREQYRYFHSLLKAHPADAIASGELHGYRSALADYEGYRAQVTQMYMGTFAGSSDLKTVKAAQEDRRALARRLRGESVAQWIRQGLKLAGYKHGDAALREAAAEDARRAREFVESELPRMRTESRPLLMTAYDASGRPDLALTEAVGGATKISDLAAPRADMDRYLRGALARLAAPEDHVYERVRAIMSAAAYVHLTGQPIPPALEKARRRDYKIMAEEFLGQASKARTDAERDQALGTAQVYAEGAQDAALLARVRAAREKKR